MATSNDDLKKLQEEVARLTKALGAETEARKAAEEEALKAAASQSVLIMQREIQEVPTGRKIKVQRAKNPWVRTPTELEFDTVEVALYYYKIDLPSSGGTDIKINGTPFFHGETYEFDALLLPTIKDIVHRAWAHEASIRGSNENAYRRPVNKTLRGNAIRH